MDKKQRILTMLEDEFNRWEELLGSLSEQKITARRPPSTWSIKDVVAHLMAWQQVSIARLEAARRDEEPVFPDWLAGADPESEDRIDRFNARIYERYRTVPWARVWQMWRDGFLTLLEMGQQIPADQLLDRERYPWLKGYSLWAVLEGIYRHHHDDHLDVVVARVAESSDNRSAG